MLAFALIAHFIINLCGWDFFYYIPKSIGYNKRMKKESRKAYYRVTDCIMYLLVNLPRNGTLLCIYL